MQDETRDPDPGASVPGEIDRGLAFGYGEDRPKPAAREPRPAGLDTPSILDRIADLTGDRPSVSLVDPGRSGDTPMLKPLARGDRQEPGKYVVQGELGRGGVGTVHRGHDQDLGRDIAIKFLHEKFKDRPLVLHRFVEEAQIGGQLQHPGIVPVYDLGMSGGRPYFTMKLVKGKTLAQLLADRKTPAEDRRRFLADFEQVCQTMAYAHARGVVHRDLKPANIMVGAFGEVQVVDWGMGKVLRRGGVADEERAVPRDTVSVVETLRSSSPGTQSVLGSVMGTPAYMPPEQAAGDIERMDERSDVFALGAILCEILTGQPPYVGEQEELLRMAALARLDDAHERLERSGVDPELVELTRECLLPAPAARPRSGEVVARRVRDYLSAAEAKIHESRVAVAEERVRASSARTQQKLAFGLVGVVAVGLAASLWFWRDAEEQRVVATQAANSERELREAAEKARISVETNLAYALLPTVRDRAKSLYPAWPHMLAPIRAWLAGESNRLCAELPALRRRLAAIEARALPCSEEERAAARRAHPRHRELKILERKLASLERAQAVRAGAAPPEEFVLDEAKVPKEYIDVWRLADWLVKPDRVVFGSETKGLALARRAVEIAEREGVPDEWKLRAVDTMAWAYFSIGLDEKAMASYHKAFKLSLTAGISSWFTSFGKIEDRIKQAGAALERLGNEVRALDREIESARIPRFTSDSDSYLYRTLRRMIPDIEDFETTDVRRVERQLTWASKIEELSITKYRDRWRRARIEILKADGKTASKLYANGPELKPQMGLVPIGMNPQTGLWEFYHLRSAWDGVAGGDPASIEIPAFDGDGRLDIVSHGTARDMPKTGAGIVFVLIPGGTFAMGAQSENPGAPNYDPHVRSTPQEVELAPYFLSKFEMTCGQWARLSDGDYPGYTLGDWGESASVRATSLERSDAFPVLFVSWGMCDDLLRRHRLVLPTEAQWERACRAGTTTTWFSGDQARSLAEYVHGRGRVGGRRTNPFGLHGMLGGVFEWCREWYTGFPHLLEPRPGDGLREVDPMAFAPRRVVRSSDLNHSEDMMRQTARMTSATRKGLRPDTRDRGLGVRAARPVLE